jgi:hypothetical protein
MRISVALANLLLTKQCLTSTPTPIPRSVAKSFSIYNTVVKTSHSWIVPRRHSVVKATSNTSQGIAALSSTKKTNAVRPCIETPVARVIVSTQTYSTKKIVAQKVSNY